MNLRKLTPLAGLVALALVAGGNRADAATATDSGPGSATGDPAMGKGSTASSPGTARPIERPTERPLVRTVTGGGTGVQAGRPASASSLPTTDRAASGAAMGEVGASSATTMRSSGGALTPQRANAAGLRQVGPADRAFMADAAVGGLFEVEAGKLAVARGSDSGVKSFGKMLTEDHGAANKALSELAAARSITLPSRLPKNQQSTLRRLARAPAGKFDRQFLQEIGIRDHESDIRKFDDAARTSSDPEVKAFAEKALPTLRKHHAEAQRLQGTVGRAS